MIAFEAGDLRLNVAYDYSPKTRDIDITSVTIMQRVNGAWIDTHIELMGWLLDVDEEDSPLESLFDLVIKDLDKQDADAADERAWQDFQENP